MKSRLGATVVLASISSVVLAEADIAKARELANVQAKIQQIGLDVKGLAAEKDFQIDELRKLEKQFGEQVNALNAIKAQIRHQERVLQDVRNKVTDANKNIQTQRQGLAGLVKAAYIVGDRQGLSVMLNQHDPALSGRMLVYFDYLGKARMQKLHLIEQQVEELQLLEAQKDAESQELQQSLEKKQQEANAVEQTKQQRQQLLIKIASSYSSKQDQLAHLTYDAKKLESLLVSLQGTDDNAKQSLSVAHEENHAVAKTVQQSAKVEKQLKAASPSETGIGNRPFAELQGQLPWPVQGAITDRFGSRRFETTWDGTVISAREGADIHAVASGKVVYADWLRGYGLMIIVDHGKGYMSLYAFNQSLHKSMGEQVKAGETLASVGRSGGRSEAALYFGIRKQGRPVDPQQWCRKPTNG